MIKLHCIELVILASTHFPTLGSESSVAVSVLLKCGSVSSKSGAGKLKKAESDPKAFSNSFFKLIKIQSQTVGSVSKSEDMARLRDM